MKKLIALTLALLLLAGCAPAAYDGPTESVWVRGSVSRTIRAASRIVSIADGVITECGTHDELIEKNGVYAGLYHTQTRIYHT